MADIVSRKARSRMMSGIRGRDTKPEIAVRKALHAAGFRYRLHSKNLPGRPDIALPKHRCAVFVHGCFWHRHRGCKFAYTPKSNVEFWSKKFDANTIRDKKVRSELRKAGWQVLVVWECKIKKFAPRKSIARIRSKTQK